LTVELSAQKRLGGALFYAIIIVLAYLVYRVFAPFLVALAWAGVLVVVSYPAHEWLARRWGRGTAATVSTIGATLVLIVPAMLVGMVFVRQGVDALQSIQLQAVSGHFAWANRLWAHMQERFPELSSVDLSVSLRQYGEQAAQFVAGRIGTIVRHTAGFLFNLSVTILAMYYLYRDGHSIIERLREVLPFEVSQRDRMLRDARELIFASVTSSFVAAAVHGAHFLGRDDGIPLPGSGFRFRTDLDSRFDQPDPARASLARNSFRGLLRHHRGNGGQCRPAVVHQWTGGNERAGRLHQRARGNQRLRVAGRRARADRGGDDCQSS
jgi:hypothetical protein